MDIKNIKDRGKLALKANYWNSVLVAFILSLLTTGAGVASRGQAGSAAEQSGQELPAILNDANMEAWIGIFAILMGIAAIGFVIGILLKIFVFNPLKVGGYQFFRRNVRESGVSAGVLKEGFGDYGHTFGTLFLTDLFIALWSLLFIIPGIVKSYSYMLVPYLLKDQPQLSAQETIALSKKIMDGHKWEAFVLDLSFLGWLLLGAVTANLVNIFWTNPYRENARAEFYLNLIGE